MKAVQASAADSVQIVNETKAAEQPAEEKAEQPASAASTTSNDQQAPAESTPLVADAGKEDKKEGSDKESSTPTETSPLEDTSNGPTVTVEVWEWWQVHSCFTLGNKRFECFLLISLWMYKHCKAFGGSVWDLLMNSIKYFHVNFQKQVKTKL